MTWQEMVVQWGTLGVLTLTLGVLSWHLVVFREQLREMEKSSRSQGIMSVVNFLQREEVRSARRKVITELEKKAKWSDEDKRDADLVCSTYDILAILIRDGAVPRRLFIEDWSPSIKRCYPILKSYIRELQKSEEAGPNYWNDFEWLYREVSKR